MTHWNSTDFARLRAHAGNLTELQALGEHVRECRECAQRASAFFQRDLAALATVVGDGPLDEEMHPDDELGAYVDGILDPDRSDAVALHAERCAACREEIEDLRRVRRGIRHDRPVGPRVGKARVQPHRWRRIASIALAASLSIVAALSIVSGINRLRTNGVPSQVASSRAVAVLPFRNVTQMANDDFLSVGIADALAARLEEDPALAMRPMASILKLPQGARARTATAALKVDGLLEGQFVSSDDVVRVTLRMIDTRSGQALWSESVDGQRGDLLTLVDRLTERTESRLAAWTGTAVARGERTSEARSTSPAAYESYLQARALAGSLVQRQYESRVLALRHAIALDPGFAAAHADLAIALELEGIVRGLSTEANTLVDAERHAREALRLDPNLAEAHLALGRVLSMRAGTFAQAIREVIIALDLKPTDTHALQILTSYFASTGEIEKARCLSDRIESLDPLSDEAKTRGYWYIEANDPEEAMRQSHRALADPATALAGRDIRGLAFILKGDLDAADREADAALQLFPGHYIAASLKAMVAAGRGDRAGAESWMASFDDEAHRNHFAAIRVAMCRAKLGDRDAALDWIELAAAIGHQRWYSLVTHPWLAPLRSEPRFRASVAAIGRTLDSLTGEAMRAYSRACALDGKHEPVARPRDHVRSL